MYNKHNKPTWHEINVEKEDMVERDSDKDLLEFLRKFWKAVGEMGMRELVKAVPYNLQQRRVPGRIF